MHRARAQIALIVGAASGALSLLFPPNLDEAAWLGVTRKWAAGATLYRTAIDNKSPGLLALVRLLDRERRYVPFRAAAVGVLAGWITWASARLARRLGASERTATILGPVVGVSAALQSILGLTPEAVVCALTLAGLVVIVDGPPVAGALLVSASVLFDPRAVALVPAAVAVAYRRRGSKTAWVVACSSAAVTAAWAGIVLTHGDLRFAIVDLNLTTGAVDSWQPLQQLVVAVEALLLPLVGLLVALETTPRGLVQTLIRSPVAAVSFVPPVAVAAASLHGFDHYWTLLLPTLPIVAGAKTEAPPTRALRWSAAILVAAAIPGLFHTGIAYADARRANDRYEAVARRLQAALRPGQTFVQLDALPYLGMLLPDRLGARSPLLGYLVQPTMRRTAELDAFARSIDRAGAVVDTGALEVAESAVFPAYRPLWRLIESKLRRFPCTVRAQGMFLHFTQATCPGP